MRVVPPFKEVEDGETGLDLGREPATVEEFALEGREEALTHRVIVGITDRAHRRPHAGRLAAEAEGEGRVLTALVGVMDPGLYP